jgi:hypothetical protein
LKQGVKNVHTEITESALRTRRSLSVASVSLSLCPPCEIPFSLLADRQTIEIEVNKNA